MTTTHLCPPNGHGVMPCCGRVPFEVMSDRMTLDIALVTCDRRPEVVAAIKGVTRPMR